MYVGVLNGHRTYFVRIRVKISYYVLIIGIDRYRRKRKNEAILLVEMGDPYILRGNDRPLRIVVS